MVITSKHYVFPVWCLSLNVGVYKKVINRKSNCLHLSTSVTFISNILVLILLILFGLILLLEVAATKLMKMEIQQIHAK